MINAIVLSLYYISVLAILYKWYQSKKDEKDYEKKNPPLYVYYETGFKFLPFSAYLIISAGMSLLTFIIMVRVFENFLVACITGLVALYAMRQRILIKSIQRVQKIDDRLPQYLNAYFNYYQLNRNVLEALDYANQEADKSFKNELSTLHLKLINNGDPSVEIEKTKQKFRNPIIRDFLDSIHQEFYEGFAHDQKVQRLIDRAERRQQMSMERKVETYAGALFIRVGMWVFIAVGILLLLISPHYLDTFRNHLIGQIGLVIIIVNTAIMTTASQRLILLTER